MAAQRIAARPPSALSGSVGINAISPRRRGGKVAFLGAGAHLLLRISAHAGSTLRSPTGGGACRAHPRSRGVDLTLLDDIDEEEGSYPLTRGRLRGALSVSGSGRLIPAHAGSTPSRLATLASTRAHPRSRGVDNTRGRRIHVAVGSSPLTRGRQCPHLLQLGEGGLIPAHAGSTAPYPARSRPARAHPRSRGVDPADGGSDRLRSGSSPLTRGRPSPRRLGGLRRRLIPAHAGSTRGRGFHRRHGGGSSPLTRGRPRRCHQERKHWRLIPAHAGSTNDPDDARLWRTAHPRSRGVDVSGFRALPGGEGSSPLTRGRRRRGSRVRACGPAHPRSRGVDTKAPSNLS